MRKGRNKREASRERESKLKNRRGKEKDRERGVDGRGKEVWKENSRKVRMEEKRGKRE